MNLRLLYTKIRAIAYKNLHDKFTASIRMIHELSLFSLFTNRIRAILNEMLVSLHYFSFHISSNKFSELLSKYTLIQLIGFFRSVFFVCYVPACMSRAVSKDFWVVHRSAEWRRSTIILGFFLYALDVYINIIHYYCCYHN